MAFKKFKIKSPKIPFAKIKSYLSTTQGLITTTVVIMGVVLLLTIIQSCTPKKGTILYGLCGAFLEQQILFPETIKHTRVEQYRKAVRIYYTHIDGFGEYQLEMIECSFIQDPAKGVQLESVFIDSIKESTEKSRTPGKGRLYKVKQDYIDKFNNSLSPAAILKNNPNLILPNQ